MLGFMLLLAVIGAALGYYLARSLSMGVILAVVVGAVYMSQSTELVMNMNNAVEITSPNQAPELWHIVEDMALVGKIPMPRVFIIDDESPNAFATGPDPEHSAVAATRGLMERLDRAELEGVMAHEVSHIRNYDIRLQTTALALASAVVFLANIGSNAMWFGPRRRDDEEEGLPGEVGTPPYGTGRHDLEHADHGLLARPHGGLHRLWPLSRRAPRPGAGMGEDPLLQGPPPCHVV